MSQTEFDRIERRLPHICGGDSMRLGGYHRRVDDGHARTRTGGRRWIGWETFGRERYEASGIVSRWRIWCCGIERAVRRTSIVLRMRCEVR